MKVWDLLNSLNFFLMPSSRLSKILATSQFLVLLLRREAYYRVFFTIDTQAFSRIMDSCANLFVLVALTGSFSF